MMEEPGLTPLEESIAGLQAAMLNLRQALADGGRSEEAKHLDEVLARYPLAARDFLQATAGSGS